MSGLTAETQADREKGKLQADGAAASGASAADTNGGEPSGAGRAQSHVGAASFSDLVRAHFAWDRERQAGTGAEQAAEEEYRRALEAFERSEGELAAAYWSTREASAVALTIRQAGGAWNPIADTETDVRLHRVSDWVTSEAQEIADLLHQCDLLAIRVGEVLRGTSERIAMRWILAVEAHLLGFIERTKGVVEPEQEQRVVAGQRDELVRIESYYHRAATKAGRIVYVSGMILGIVLLALAVALASLLLWPAGVPESASGQAVLVGIGGGALGALVSAMSRMGAGPDAFKVDFEVGRPMLRRLGFYRPLVGAVFGLASYFLLASGLLNTQPPEPGERLYFWGTVAFLAGFSERFTSVIFGSAQRTIGGGDEERAAAAKTGAEPEPTEQQPPSA